MTRHLNSQAKGLAVLMVVNVLVDYSKETMKEQSSSYYSSQEVEREREC